MITFRGADHTIKKNEVIEVWHDNRMIAAIYPDEEGMGIKVISKYFRHRGQFHIIRTQQPNDREMPGEIRISGLANRS